MKSILNRLQYMKKYKVALYEIIYWGKTKFKKGRGCQKGGQKLLHTMI